MNHNDAINTIFASLKDNPAEIVRFAQLNSGDGNYFYDLRVEWEDFIEKAIEGKLIHFKRDGFFGMILGKSVRVLSNEVFIGYTYYKKVQFTLDEPMPNIKMELGEKIFKLDYVKNIISGGEEINVANVT